MNFRSLTEWLTGKIGSGGNSNHWDKGSGGNNNHWDADLGG